MCSSLMSWLASATEVFGSDRPSAKVNYKTSTLHTTTATFPETSFTFIPLPTLFCAHHRCEAGRLFRYPIIQDCCMQRPTNWGVTVRFLGDPVK
jgi:hypothetical protein